ncbi:MAG TPA: Wzz/FepE/Etk N-terminal domain-containing protein [Bryobacteraceae bacterium]|nr:Wzz/FepE/Etk N-terminal domain-containing protein [Bryobacteraceae bacterium]
MYQQFDPFEYVDYLRRRWRVVLLACVAAVAVSLPLSLLLPKRYTATASIVIDPPAGIDPRTATSLSPVYLESLKTYERYAESDTLFARASERFHLLTAGSSQTIESLKRSLLKVSKLRDTKIMEINVTLRDPKLAQNVAQYIAEETVTVSQGENTETDKELADGAQKQAAAAQATVDRAQKALLSLSNSGPVDALQSEVDANVQLLLRLREQLVGAEADVAEYQQQQTQANGQFAREQLQAAKARAAVLEKRSQELQRSIQEKEKVLAGRIAKRDELQAELQTAQNSYESAAKSLREALASAGTRGERLRVLDPGIVPQRPSSPNVPLNVAAALLLALVASVVYLSFDFAFRRRAVGFEPAVSRSMRA